MDKRTEIIDAAQSLFAQFGLKKVTTDDIARKARVSKATVYKHYKNKSDIFTDVTRIEAEQLLEAIREAVDNEDTVTGKFKAHLLMRICKIHEFSNFHKVTQDTWGESWPHIVQVRKRFLAEEMEIVKSILRLGNKRKELNVQQIDLAAHIMIVAVTSVEYNWAMDELHIPLEKYVDMMLYMLIHGLKRGN